MARRHRPTGSFTTGGAEANATGLLLALLAAFPDVGSKGLRRLPRRPVFYAPSESHLACVKIARQAGLGHDSVRLIRVDGTPEAPRRRGLGRALQHCQTLCAPHLGGIERADSITVDAHKWLSVPMGAGMFVTPHSDVLASAFEVTTSYMPAASTGVAADPYTTSMQCGPAQISHHTTPDNINDLVSALRKARGPN